MPRFPSPVLLAIVVVFAVIVIAVIPVWILRDWNATLESEAFVSTPQFLIWILVLCVQAAVWVGGFVFVVLTAIKRWRDLPTARTRSALALGLATLTLVALAGVLIFGQRLGLYPETPRIGVPSDATWPLADHETKVRPLVLISLAIGGLAIAGMWLTAAGLADLAQRLTEDAVTRFLALRTELTSLLAVAGALVGLATLSSGSLREAVQAASRQPVYRDVSLRCLQRALAATEPSVAELRAKVRAEFDELRSQYPHCDRARFDQEYVLAYGLLFTGILGIAFLPCYLVMRRAGEALGEKYYALPPPGDEAFLTAVEQRRAFDALLQTNLSATTTFKAGVAILTPLAASVVSIYLPS